MAKNNRNGKAAIWTSKTIALLRKKLATPEQRLIFEVSLWTGERMGAIVQLKVSDVYHNNGKVKEFITFPGITRKSSKHGTAKTRQIFIHDVLRSQLRNYTPPSQGYLFPS
ncbi:MAG: site-specific integrase, partial [Cyanobacteria bacterium P01_G01_bin.49]